MFPEKQLVYFNGAIPKRSNSSAAYKNNVPCMIQ